MHGADVSGFELIGHSDLAGHGDGMQVMRLGDALYVGHLGPSGMGTTILDVSDEAKPQVVEQWAAPAGTHTHKVQIADGLLMVNHERFRAGDTWSAGMAIYDVADPFAPRRVGFWSSTGYGVHRIVWEGGRYAYVSAVPDGFDDRIWVVVDVSDPASPTEVSRWWWPGQWRGGGEVPGWPEGERWSVHHAMVHDDRAYVGLWDGGMVILDISDLANPRQISHLEWEVGGHTHTCLPLPERDLLVVTDEVLSDGCVDDPHMVRVVDISDEENPRVAATCPHPEGDFCERGLRFGAHCVHENRAGSYQSQEVVFATYFNAGLRVYDLADPFAPQEIGHWIPECPPGHAASQINDVWVDQDLVVYATDRVNGGVYILEPVGAVRRRVEAAAR